MGYNGCQTKTEKEEYIRAITNPQTPKDWEIALTDPNSPQFKILMNIINEGIAIEYWCVELMTRWAEMDEAEKQRMIKESLKEAAYKYDHQNDNLFQTFKAPSLASEVKFNFNDKLYEVLQVMRNVVLSTINDLIEEKNVKTNKLKDTETKCVNFTKKWDEDQNKSADTIIEKLKENKLVVFVNKEDAENAKKQLMRKDPLNLMKVNPSLGERAEAVANNKVEKTALAKVMVGWMAIGNELHMRKMIKENGSPMDDKDQKQKIGKVAKEIAASEYTNKIEQCENAISLRKDKHDQSNELKEIDIQLDKNQKKLRAVDAQMESLISPKLDK